MDKKSFQKVILCILDGWGYSLSQKYNAIYHAKTSNYDLIDSIYPKALLSTSGSDVGLPNGQMGNSEVGHTNIGAGRIVYSELTRIDKFFSENRLPENNELNDLINFSKKNNGEVHILGLVSAGGVHSHQEQIIGMIDYISELGININFHVITDGRDVGPKTALGIIKNLIPNLPKNTKICTLMGRFYAMDRDQRWDRTELAFRAILDGIGKRYSTAYDAIKKSYETNITDEFIRPSVIGDYNGLIGENNSFIFMNFRADRSRQILTSILEPDFDKFKRSKVGKIKKSLGLISYSKDLDELMSVLIPKESIENTLGSFLESNKLQQLRLAETEKYAHVTYFFNGGSEKPSENEDRKLIKSPLVDTYDKKPEMSCSEVCNFLVDAISKQNYDFILVNFANPDMVGHTGNFEATKKACEALDECLGRLMEAANSTDSIILLTSDHGNAELMYDDELNMTHTRHTLNPVPFYIISPENSLKVRSKGRLCDIAPTVLEIFGLQKPSEMSGLSLLK